MMKFSFFSCLIVLLEQVAAQEGWQECATIDVKQFNPTISWHSSPPDTHLEMYNKFIGTIKVVSDYRNPDESERFDLALIKYEKRQGSNGRVKKHFITLPGGPGGSSKAIKAFASNWHNIIDGIVYYGINYRGHMQFALLGDKSDPEPDLETVIERGPFPLKDLTMENAARDVAMIITAIQSSPEWLYGDQIILEGASAGARWAHLVIAQYPDLVNLAFLSAVPSFGQLPSSNFDGLIERCLLDEYCSAQMGTDLKTTFYQSLWDVSNPEYNECTRMFHEDLSIYDFSKDTDKPRSPRKKLIRILRMLGQFFTQVTFKDMPYANEQIGFVFIRALHDCKDPLAFRDDILPTVKACFFGSKGREQTIVEDYSITTVNTDPEVDEFQHQVIHSTSDYNPVIRWNILRFRGEKSERPHQSRASFKRIKQWFNRLAKYIKDARYFEEKPIVTNKTQIYIFAGRMDIITSPDPAYGLYQQITAPLKVWVLYDNFSHTSGYGSAGHLEILAGTILNQIDPWDIEDHISTINNLYKLDWSFQNHDGMNKLWDQVEPAPGVSTCEKTKTSVLPTCLYEASKVINLGPSPQPEARCIIISKHPMYRVKFGSRLEQNLETATESF